MKENLQPNQVAKVVCYVCQHSLQSVEEMGRYTRRASQGFGRASTKQWDRINFFVLYIMTYIRLCVCMFLTNV